MDSRQYPADTSYYRQPTGQHSIIRPTQGFAWESSGSFGQAAEHDPYPSPQQNTRYVESSSMRRPKDKSKSKDKHKPKHRSRDEYPAVDNHAPRDFEAPSSSNTRNDVPAPHRQSSTAYPAHTEYQPSRSHPHDSRSPNHDMQRHSQPSHSEARDHSRRSPMEYTPAPHRSYSPDYHPQSPTDESHRQQSFPPHRNHVQESIQEHCSPSPPATHETQYQPSDAAPTPDNSKQRALRLVTLLIEDIRLKESQLAEVYVPLSHRSGGQIWADAVDVTDALQSGPSRIDGPAKVSTTRSGFKQIFFRVSANGEVICKPANLQLTPEKTLSVLVEDPDRAIALLQRASSGMLTPSTETMAMSPGMPRPLTPLPADGFDSQRYYESQPEPRRPSSSRKRRRSISREVRHPSEQQERSRQSYHDPPQTTRDYRPSRPPAQNDASHTPRSSPESSSGSGSDMSSHSSGSGAYQNTQPPQISPLSQAGTLVQMSPGSISDPNTTPSRSTQDTYPNQQRVSGTTPVPRTSYSPNNAPSQRYPPPAEQQRPPSKKQRQDTYVSSTPQGQPSNNDSRTSTSQPPMASLTPPPSRPVSNPPPQSAGGFASYSNARTTYGPPSTVSSTPPAAHVQRPSPAQASASTGRPTPVANSGPPPAAVQSDPKVDDAVALYLRGMFKQEPAFSAYLEARNKNLPVSQWIKHLEYVQTKFEQYVGKPVPEGIDGAGSAITKTQLCRAFYQNNVTWGEECLDVVALSKLYGPGGTHMVDPDAVDLYNEPEGVTTTLQMRRYLALLRNIHAKWLEEHAEQRS